VLARRGDTVECVVCGWRFDHFKDSTGRSDAICWRCGSHERHRAILLLLRRRPELLALSRTLLHFAPEWGLRRQLSALPHLHYVTADLDMPGVDLRLDLTALALPDAGFDAVICSHVLEHVDDDRVAMRELRRIVAPGGWALVMVPLDVGREHTYEDPTIQAPADRQRAFWQHDHVRLYGSDIERRLSDAGFAVETVLPARQFGAPAMERYRLVAADHLWLCRPR
jgi:SAM-dependent methyltransferase